MRRGGGPGRVGGREGGSAGFGRGTGGNRVAQALNLSEDQKASIETLRQRSRDEIAPLADRLRLAERDLRRAVFSDKPDAAVTKKLSTDVATVRQQIAEKRLDAEKAFAAVLTVEQRLKLRTGSSVAGGRPGGRRGLAPGFGPPRGDGPALDRR
jgi:Spy/CpxP family protein refolding chaperone